jgi:hypothetical protein
VSLGVVGIGQEARADLTLANPGSQALTIERVETSCSCLTIAPRSIRIAPGESKTLSLEFDPSEEPDFRGGLSIDVTGFAAGGVAFHTRAKLEVRTEAPEEIGELVPSPNEEAQP